MPNNGPDFKLPRKIDGLLAALSKIYANDGETALQEIVVNARVRINEAVSVHSDWGREIYGHAMYLVVPEPIYLKIVKAKDKIQARIKSDINNHHNFQDEYVDAVFLEFEEVDDPDWRKKSGRLLSGKRFVLPEAEKRIWGDSGYRLFLSHKSEVKVEVAKLKEDLAFFGITCFVAHEDIKPTKEWQSEIENALDSMDALAALLIADFHNSDWTDQEVGFALGRGVPIVPVKLGQDPCGFIGKSQALPCTWETAAKEITKILVKQEKMMDAYIQAVRQCPSWDGGNKLAEILPALERITPQHEADLIDAFNINDEVSGSFGFRGSKPHVWGNGLVHHLTRLTNKEYKYTDAGLILVE